MLIPFGEYLPDQPAFQVQGSSNIINVVPKTKGSYGPAPEMSAVTGALGARCQGAAYTRDKSANVWGFAGDATKLYKNVAGSTDWVDISPLDATKTITAITQADPGNVTAVGHGYTNGDSIYIDAVVGMTEINGLQFTVAVVDADNFTIGASTAAYSAYVSGGTAQKVLSYTTPNDGRWSIAQFGERMVASNYGDAIQSYVMAGDDRFSDLSADAPKARYISRVRDFLMVANTNDGIDGEVPQRVWWSAIGDPTTWPTPGSDTAAQLESGFIDLYGGGGWNQGLVAGLSGADVVVFQERNIWRGMYIGPPVVFSWTLIENARGTPAPGSVVSAGSLAYYLADDGFYACDGSQSMPIGQGKVDKMFWDEVDITSLYRISAAVDPVNKLIYWAYPGPQNDDGTPNRILVYHYVLNQFSKIIDQTVEIMVASALSAGYTLEQLDAFGTLETLPFSLDSRAWTGGRLNLAAFDTTHKLALFSGMPLAATMDSTEANLNDMGLAYVSRTWPMVDTEEATIQVGTRNRLADVVTWGVSSGMTRTTGSCPVRATGVYHRCRISIPAGVTWTHAQGMQFDYRKAGKR